MVKNFILASQSPQRKILLSQIGFEPYKIEPADIDETPEKGEKPSQYVKRMAKEKALFVANKNKGEVVLASDTVIVCGTTIIQKSKTDKEQEKVMKMLSGKTHRVLTSVCVVDKKGKTVVKLNTTKIKMKKLTILGICLILLRYFVSDTKKRTTTPIIIAVVGLLIPIPKGVGLILDILKTDVEYFIKSPMDDEYIYGKNDLFALIIVYLR